MKLTSEIRKVDMDTYIIYQLGKWNYAIFNCTKMELKCVVKSPKYNGEEVYNHTKKLLHVPTPLEAFHHYKLSVKEAKSKYAEVAIAYYADKMKKFEELLEIKPKKYALGL
jgi:hypothetical protein